MKESQEKVRAIERIRKEWSTQEGLMQYLLRMMITTNKSVFSLEVPDPAKFEDYEMELEDHDEDYDTKPFLWTWEAEASEFHGEILSFLITMKRLYEVVKTKTIRCFICGTEYVKLPDPAKYDLSKKDDRSSLKKAFQTFRRELGILLDTCGVGCRCRKCLNEVDEEWDETAKAWGMETHMWVACKDENGNPSAIPCLKQGK